MFTQVSRTKLNRKHWINNNFFFQIIPKPHCKEQRRSGGADSERRIAFESSSVFSETIESPCSETSTDSQVLSHTKPTVALLAVEPTVNPTASVATVLIELPGQCVLLGSSLAYSGRGSNLHGLLAQSGGLGTSHSTHTGLSNSRLKTGVNIGNQMASSTV